MAKRIYMDYAGATPLDPRVYKAMLPYFGKKFGNPSSIHAEGVLAKKALETARRSVAGILQARADEIFFTSSGTELNNMAILGIVAETATADSRGLHADLRRNSEMHFITTAIEHSSVLECFRELESRGAKVDYAQVRENGIVEPNTIAKLLRPETVLVSVGYANNEIGVIQPIRKISKVIRAHNLKTFFHSDGSQAPLYLDCNTDRLGVDLMTLDGHKMYGPKGVGILFVRRGTPLTPIIFGGGQERGLRSATENVALIVGISRALEIASSLRKKESTRLAILRDYFHSDVLKNIRTSNLIVNGDMKERLPNNLNISIPGTDTEFLLLKLDAEGIAVSTKSSCLGTEGGSYVVRALGGGEARALSTLRFSFGRQTTKKDIDTVIKKLAVILKTS